MFDIFLPDIILKSFDEVTPELLLRLGARLLICDIDNTLVTYDDERPTPAVVSWLQTMTDAGIGVAFVSNNTAERVALFCEGMPFYSLGKAGKPSVRGITAALEYSDISPDKAAVLGDQLFTDIAAGKRLGLAAILVPPIKDKKTLFFRAKRLLEVPFLRIYRRRKERQK